MDTYTLTVIVILATIGLIAAGLALYTWAYQRGYDRRGVDGHKRLLAILDAARQRGVYCAPRGTRKNVVLDVAGFMRNNMGTKA